MGNRPLIRPAISWGKRGIGGGKRPLGSHDKKKQFERFWLFTNPNDLGHQPQ